MRSGAEGCSPLGRGDRVIKKTTGEGRGHRGREERGIEGEGRHPRQEGIGAPRGEGNPYRV